MKKNYIRYEDLSKEIKDEIEIYRTAKTGKKKPKSAELAMVEWFENNFDEWLIKRFAKGKESNKRKHFRLEVELPIKIINTLIESSKDDTEARDYIGKVVNISRGGLYFKYHKPIELSSIIKVKMNLSEIDREMESIEALAMVVRLDKMNENENGIGVVFSSIYDTNKDSLDLFILKNLSYHIYSK